MVELEKSKGELVTYKDKQGPQIEARLQGETVWLSQQQVAEIFGVQKAAISKHIRNIF